MLTYEKTVRKPRHFQSFTGITIHFVTKDKIRIQKCRRGETHQKTRRMVCRASLQDVGQKQNMLPIHYRLYTSYAFVSYMFGLDMANVCNDIKYLKPAVKSSSPSARKIRRCKNGNTMESLNNTFLS